MSQAAPVVRSRLISHEALCDALRDYLAGNGITMSGMDEIAKIADGHTQKIIGKNPKRTPNSRDMLTFVASCGLAFSLHEDPELVALRDARLAQAGPTAMDRWQPERREMHRQRDRLRPEFYAIAAQQGGLARAAMLSSKQRSDIASYAAKCRWAKRQCARARRAPA